MPVVLKKLAGSVSPPFNEIALLLLTLPVHAEMTFTAADLLSAPETTLDGAITAWSAAQMQQELQG